MPTDEGKVVRLEILRRPCGSEEPACWRVFPPTARPKRSIIAPATWAVALTSGTLTGWAPALAAVAAGLAAARPPVARWVLIALVAGSSVLLLAQRDIHGTALTGGLLVGLTLATTTEHSRT
jgi:hypothetical protein